MRVRRSLDTALDDIIYDLRHAGIRTNKTELVEMLLLELRNAHPAGGIDDLVERVRRCRAVLPRR